MFLLVPAYPGGPGSKAVKRSLLLLLLLLYEVHKLNPLMPFCDNMSPAGYSLSICDKPFHSADTESTLIIGSATSH